jgi:hypothetical protein
MLFAERDALNGRGVRAADDFGEAVEPEPAHVRRMRDAGCGMRGQCIQDLAFHIMIELHESIA